MNGAGGVSPYREPPACTHGVTFDEEEVRKAAPALFPVSEIRRRWPRLDGPCPLGCGYNGIAYASYAHYIFGDW